MNDKYDDIDIDEEFDYKCEKEITQKKTYGNKSGIGIKIYAVLITLLAGTFIVVSLILFRKNRTDEREVSEYVKINEKSESEVKNIIKDYMENGKGTIAMLRTLFPENIIVYGSNKYSFIPVAENAAKNDIDNDNIAALDSGELQYIVNDKVVSHKGIDVSKYQGEVDWNKVAADGVEFAMIRLGYRGYGSGTLMIDETAIKNIEEASKAGIKVGVYFFSQAVSEKEAVEEAKFVIDNIKKYKITYPIVFDTEEIVNEDTRTEGLSTEELTGIAIAFCEEVKKEGYIPAIYANLRWFALSLDMSELNEYDKWYAYYDKELYFPYKINMWQYTENGTVDGITGNVDLNICFKDYE